MLVVSIIVLVNYFALCVSKTTNKKGIENVMHRINDLPYEKANLRSSNQEVIEASSATASYSGYFYVNYFEDEICNGTINFSYGYQLNNCVIQYDQDLNPIGSVQGSCSNDVFTFTLYSDTACTVYESSSGFSTGSCFEEYSGYGYSTEEIPITTDDFLVVRGYEGTEASTCDGSPTVYEAYRQGTCLTGGDEFTGSEASSFILVCYSYESRITDLVFGGSSTCTGVQPYTEYINSSCISATSDAFAFYNSLLDITAYTSVRPETKVKVENVKKVNKKVERYLPKTEDVEHDEQLAMDIRRSLIQLAKGFKLEPSELSHTSIIPQSAGDDGYLVAEAYLAIGCNSESYIGETGIALNTCIVSYEEGVPIGSIYASCDNVAATVSTYTTLDCSSDASDVATYYPNTCGNSTDISAYVKSARYSCPATSVVTVPTDTFGNFFYDNTTEECSASPSEYQILNTNICLNDFNISYYISCYDDVPIATIYNETGCTGAVSSIYLNKTCEVESTLLLPSANGYYQQSFCQSLSYNITDDYTPTNDDYFPLVNTTDDDYFVITQNATYLFTYVDILCGYLPTQAPTPSPVSSSSNSGTGLSSGEAAGVAIGVIVGVAAIAAIIYLYVTGKLFASKSSDLTTSLAPATSSSSNANSTFGVTVQNPIQ